MQTEERATSASNGHELTDCDLVMKGGITSGIVYPPAIVKLAERYRFRSIGGTSAGAIAAAGAAAAEFGRQKGGPGFRGLREISDWIGTDNHLLNLFQPSTWTRPLLSVALAAISIQNVKGLGRIGAIARLIGSLVLFTLPAFVLLPVIAILVALSAGASPLDVIQRLPALIGWVLLLLGLGFAGSIVAVVALLFWYVPSHNLFGICTGHSADITGNDTHEQPDNLTDWATATFNSIAFGHSDGKPLTFGDLGTACVDLKMVTTSLGHGRPYVMPFVDHRFIFDVREMSRLFPRSVVDHLCAYGPRSLPASSGVPAIDLQRLPEQYRFLPPAEQQPVVLAARMSLSFPVLLSAVPLYTVSYECVNRASRDGVVQPTRAETDLQRNWFSDGGISSNFPIHFFDEWLPPYPTLGINLTKLNDAAIDLQRGAVRDTHRSLIPTHDGASDARTKQRIYLPRADAAPDLEWQPVTDFGSFFGAVWNTAQNFRDTMQANLPSYRERLVQIRLANSEGGLNLQMDEKKVQSLIELGESAGQRLQPAPQGEFDFDYHRWTRTLVLMDQLELRIRSLREAVRNTDYKALITNTEPTAEPPFPYGRRDTDWCRLAWARVELLTRLADEWNELDAQAGLEQDVGLFGGSAPVPPSVLRVTPEV